jgi:MFS family permease
MAVTFMGILLGNLVFPALGDRRGHKSSLVAMGPVVAGACLVALFARSPLEFAGAFVLLGIATSARRVSMLAMVMEFGSEAERPHYLAIFFTVFWPFMRLGPFLGGVLRDLLGPDAAFAPAIALALAGTLVLGLRVRDPRGPARPGGGA